MPEPVRSSQRYLPGLDGLRALAVLAVVAYHLDLGWAPGGLLGVGVFFTLSGYLITDLLLGHWSAHGRLGLGDFWLRRARRLLPALFVVLAVVTAWVTVLDRSQLADLRGAVGAAAGYVSNWYYIAAHGSYFARFAPPSPLDHLWSLAVEEQFYLIWPWLLLLGLTLLPGRGETGHSAAGPTMAERRADRIRWLALPTLGLAAASTVAMLLLYHPGVDPTRVYEGTDTRALGLLAGAALAMVWPSRRPGSPTMRTRLLMDGAGLAGLAVIAMLVWQVGQYSPFAYRGGLVLLSVATAGVVAATACAGSLVGRVLGWGPLRWIGVRSYGIYLWHFPVIVLTSPADAGENLPRGAAQLAASIVLAALSWRFIEEPIRHGGLGRLWAGSRRAGSWPRPANLGGWTAMTAGAGVVAVACVGLAGPVPGAGTGSEASGPSALGAMLPPAPGRTSAAGPAGRTARRSAGPAANGAGPAPQGSPPETSCASVAHLGDSTSDGLISPDYLPHRSQRMKARYQAVGVRSTYFDIAGARSVVETLPGQTNGYDAARSLVRRGFRGCWVIALGTNDTADVVVGSQVGLMTRIKRMMSVTGGEPVLWVTVRSLRERGPYSETHMQAWNRALEQACSAYPNMRIFDWAAVARRGWFISDGIHYTSAGYAARARMIADALAAAFPRGGRSQGCTVR